jgi:hypothetical protein
MRASSAQTTTMMTAPMTMVSITVIPQAAQYIRLLTAALKKTRIQLALLRLNRP